MPTRSDGGEGEEKEEEEEEPLAGAPMGSSEAASVALELEELGLPTRRAMTTQSPSWEMLKSRLR